MKTRFSSMLSLLLVLTTCLTLLPVTGTAEVLSLDETYTGYVEMLNEYMENDVGNSVDIGQLKDRFFDMGSYKCSTEFWLYAETMYALEQNNYAYATNYAITLEYYSAENEPFYKLLHDAEFTDTYPAIRPVEEMIRYIQAREEEQNNNATKASNLYGECLRFFDARARYQTLRPDLETLYAEGMNCFRNGDYSEALRIAEDLQRRGFAKGDTLYSVAKAQLDRELSTPVPVATPVPVTPVPVTPIPEEPVVQEPAAATGDFTVKGDSHKYTVRLSWAAVANATKYRVYYAVVSNGNKNFKQLNETGNITFSHTDTKHGVNNYYYVEAVDQNGNVLKTSGEVKVYVSPTATPTPKPTPKPTWSAWSSWSATNPGAATSTRQVEKKTQYRYRTSSTSQQWSAWSDWSAWSNTAVSGSDTREVRTQNVNVNTTTKQYTYTRWKYYHTTYGAWYYSYAQYTGSGYKSGSGTWQSKTTTSPLGIVKYPDGKPEYEGVWFNQTVTDKVTTTTVTQYSYRTRSLQNVTTWSNWSSWQDASVASSSTCQVETRTVYRYRTLK